MVKVMAATERLPVLDELEAIDDDETFLDVFAEHSRMSERGCTFAFVHA